MVGVFDGVCVHCAVHDQHGLDGPLFFGGLWVGLLSGYIVSLTGGFRLFWGVACLVVLVVLARGLHPVSFPNLEVKPFCADGTATGGLWESRALPTVSLNGGGVDPCRVGTPTIFFCFVCGVFGGWLWELPPFCV